MRLEGLGFRVSGSDFRFRVLDSGYCVEHLELLDIRAYSHRRVCKLAKGSANFQLGWRFGVDAQNVVHHRVHS